MKKKWAPGGMPMASHFESLRPEPGEDLIHPGRTEASGWVTKNFGSDRDRIVTTMLRHPLYISGKYGDG